MTDYPDHLIRRARKLAGRLTELQTNMKFLFDAACAFQRLGLEPRSLIAQIEKCAASMRACRADIHKLREEMHAHKHPRRPGGAFDGVEVPTHMPERLE